MSETMLQILDPDPESDDQIVLECPASYATIGDPTDSTGTRALPLPAAEEGAERLQFGIPDAATDAAHALLRKHDKISVVSDPTGASLEDVKSKREVKREWASKQVENSERQRRRKSGFDPAEDKPANSSKIDVKKAYDELLDAGEDEEAERLRSLDTVRSQKKYVSKLRHVDVVSGRRGPFDG